MAGMDVRKASQDRLRSKRQVGGPVTVTGEGATTDATEKEKLTSGLGSGKAKGTALDEPIKTIQGETPAQMAERMRKLREKKNSGATMQHAGAALSKRLD